MRDSVHCVHGRRACRAAAAAESPGVAGGIDISTPASAAAVSSSSTSIPADADAAAGRAGGHAGGRAKRAPLARSAPSVDASTRAMGVSSAALLLLLLLLLPTLASHAAAIAPVK